MTMTAAELVNGGALVLLMGLILGFWRALTKGDLVLGSQHAWVVGELKKVTDRADAAALDAKSISDTSRQQQDRLIDLQAKQLEVMSKAIADRKEAVT